MTCPYCNAEAVLELTSKIIYGRDYGAIWRCSQYPRCDAYVGCHKGTTRALGTLADSTLRAARKRAHAAFDPLWINTKDRRIERKKNYLRLANHLGIDADDCHIGMFDVVTCSKVVEVVKSWRSVPSHFKT